MRAVVSCPGTCGELFQGWIDEHKCLISCPVSLYSILEVEVKQGDGAFFIPDGMEKTESALKLASLLWGVSNLDIGIKRIGSLLPSRGYASSTSDILCSLYGLARCINMKLSPLEATKIAATVEPSDSIAWEKLTLLDHRNCFFHRELSPVPPLSLLLLDPGGAIDTVEFNAEDSELLSCRHDSILSDLAEGLKNSDWSKLGKAATDSAVANQPVLFKPYLERLIDSTERAGGLGVVTAHSGTISGVLLPEDKSSSVVELILEDMDWAGEWKKVDMVPGGAKVMEVFK